MFHRGIFYKKSLTILLQNPLENQYAQIHQRFDSISLKVHWALWNRLENVIMLPHLSVTVNMYGFHSLARTEFVWWWLIQGNPHCPESGHCQLMPAPSARRPAWLLPLLSLLPSLGVGTGTQLSIGNHTHTDCDKSVTQLTINPFFLSVQRFWKMTNPNTSQWQWDWFYFCGK